MFLHHVMPVNDGFVVPHYLMDFMSSVRRHQVFRVPFNLVIAPTTTWLNPLSYNKPSCFSSHVFWLPPDFILYVSHFHYESFLQGQHGRCRGQLIQAKVFNVSILNVFTLVLCALRVLKISSVFNFLGINTVSFGLKVVRALYGFLSWLIVLNCFLLFLKGRRLQGDVPLRRCHFHGSASGDV